jgi:hypothetical protein
MIRQASPARHRGRNIWSIGLYAGPSPLALAPVSDVDNPVITAADVTEFPAEFVADPFMIQVDSRWFLFFEAFDSEQAKGVIGLATSTDTRVWNYQGVVLEEPFHLSYPHVFAHEGKIYLIPETLGPAEVALYQADLFPIRWRRLGRLIPGEFADPTPYFHDGHWWLFVGKSARPYDSLRLFQAANLSGPWTEHPGSPLIVGDARRARPAGRVVVAGGRPIRFAQDCHSVYGQAVRGFEILRLSTTEYEERATVPEVILAAGDAPWNSGRVHHVDAHEVKPGHWIACVDGSIPLGEVIA